MRGLALAAIMITGAWLPLPTQAQIEIQQLTVCQVAYGKAYQAYWGQRNRLQAQTKNSTMDPDAFSAAMSALNALWQPFSKEIDAANAKASNSPECEALSDAFRTKLAEPTP